MYNVKVSLNLFRTDSLGLYATQNIGTCCMLQLTLFFSIVINWKLGVDKQLCRYFLLSETPPI